MFSTALKKNSAFDTTCTITYPDKEVCQTDDDIIKMPMKCISEQEQMLKSRKKQYKPAERLRLQIYKSQNKDLQVKQAGVRTRDTIEKLSNSMNSILTLF